MDSLAVDASGITIRVVAKRRAVRCPDCGTVTQRVHSRYTRTLRDLPWHGTAVRLDLNTRKFFCDSSACSRRIFTERLPRTAASYARRTHRFCNTLRAVGLALGGEAGQRLLHQLGLGASADTLLRRLRASVPAAEPAASPRVLGIDDWAWRKGHSYGTILIDLEQSRVVDLLPDRSADSVANWLQKRPGAEIISRDRSRLYAEGASRGAPDAVQVADRWHLLRNLTDAVERALEGCSAVLQQAAPALSRPRLVESPLPQCTPPACVTRAEQAKAERRARRMERYQEVVELRDKGESLHAIARQTGLERRTIRRWLRADGFPERKERSTAPSQLDPHRAYLKARVEEGCTNAAQLWREIRERGFDGRPTIVGVWVRQLRRGGPEPAARTSKTPSLRRTAWLLVLAEAEMKEEELAYVRRLMELSPELACLRELAEEFRRLLREKDLAAFDRWLAGAENSLLRGFAASLRSDLAAVRAAVELPWSNGATEGHVNRLKLIKRSMFGRARFDLLRERVLHAA